MTKKKNKTTKKKNNIKDKETVGYYYDGFKTWVLTKKRWILSI